MSKFKVGDKVKIVKPWGVDSQYTNNIVTISKIVCDDTCFAQSMYDVEENARPWVDMELEYVQNDVKIVDKFVKNKEENEMRNEVLELWYSRNKENISKKYKEFKDKYFEERYSIIKEYNKLIEDFESNLEHLYNNSMSDLQPVLKENNSCNVFKYVVDKDKITDEAEEVYKEDEIKEYSNLNDTYKEIYALLSMSSDLEYQQSVLIEYGIIDKKTKRMIANEDSSK